MIGVVKPDARAIVKNWPFKYGRCGMPKEILDKPITVGKPNFSLYKRNVLSVCRALSSPLASVNTNGSSKRSCGCKP